MVTLVVADGHSHAHLYSHARRALDGLIGLPVTVIANGWWSTTNWTGTKTECGPYFCEFAPMPVGTLTVIPHGLGASVRVPMRGAGVAVVEFRRE